MRFKSQKIDKEKLKRGFTLIETFVAITVLLIALAGPFTLVMKALSVAKPTKGQIISMYLAQEAIEYVRNIRDENILTGNNWLTDLNGNKMVVGSPPDYTISYLTDSTRNCIGAKCIINAPIHRDVTTCDGDCPPLKFNSTSKLYGYNDDSGWAETVFTREIEIKEIVLDREVIITVTMEWQEGAGPTKSFVVKEHLLNWQ